MWNSKQRCEALFTAETQRRRENGTHFSFLCASAVEESNRAGCRKELPPLPQQQDEPPEEEGEDGEADERAGDADEVHPAAARFFLFRIVPAKLERAQRREQR